MAVSLFHKGRQSWSLLEVEGKHVTPVGVAEYLLGAAFVRELTEDELRAFVP